MPETASDDIHDLARFGYRQELDRSLGSFSSFAAGFSYISILTGVFQAFSLGYAAAGPAFFWTWPVVLAGQMAVALGFAELAAHYPLSGGVYQWSRRLGSPALGWMAGWVYLASSLISLAAVALALQATLPRIAPVFQVIGNGAGPLDQARNAVLLGSLLIGLTTVINSVGVRWLARINNAGVIVELLGVVLLIGLLFLHARRGPAVVLRLEPPATAEPGGGAWLPGLLAAAVMPSYVLYGFDTAGTLAEETRDPRRRAPWAILQAILAAGLAGGLLIVAGLMAALDPAMIELARIDGGLPLIVQQALGRNLGSLFLMAVVFAVSVCALAVHAGSIRVMYAMARDNRLPLARRLAHVTTETRTPVLPALVTGAGALLVLLLHMNHPRIMETLCSVAIVWANLAYLMVSWPLLRARLRGWPKGSEGTLPTASGLPPGLRAYRLGRPALFINAAAVLWGLLVIVNIGWPRAGIYGSHPIGRYSAALSTLLLLACGAILYLGVRRRNASPYREHASPLPPAAEPASQVGPLLPLPVD